MLLLAALFALPSAALTGSRLIGGSFKTPIPQLAAFAPWATIGWFAVVLVLLAGRWWLVAAVAGVVLFVQLCWILPAPGAGVAALAPAGAIDVRVMTINVKIGSADVDQIAKLVVEHEVGLLVVEEATQEFSGRLMPVLAGFPYRVQSNPGLPTGTVIWSRWPITALGPALGVGHEIRPAMLQVPGAVPVTLTGVHTVSPGRGRIHAWNQDLRTLRTVAAGTTGAQVMLGDFNASRDHAPFRAVTRAGLVDAAETARMAPWSGVTWPADRGWLPATVRLDHVLVTPGPVAVGRVLVERVAGTDHKAVIANLQIAPST
jgi:endonuclease/exonuclease/phosphatase (EEP) superfamily protein YafD